MTALISAIPTRYAGCHFRSRLEARWAVFFDHVAIDWEYEPQGFLVGMYGENLRPYLPDFYLPGLGLWVEVKGADEQIDRELLLAAVVPWGGLPRSPAGPPVTMEEDLPDGLNRMLVLGPRPTPTPQWDVRHSLLHFRKGIVYRNWASFSVSDVDIDAQTYLMDVFGGDGGEGDYMPLPLLSYREERWDSDPPAFGAYRAARSARFEHGESGAT
jgi:hypothetical protein